MADTGASSGANSTAYESKGKGKAEDNHAERVMPEDEEDDSDDEVDLEQEETGADEEEADEDNMEEIDEDNIIEGGRRTRGKAIDFAKAAEQLGEDEDEDEDEDDDFEDPDESMQD